MHSIKFDYYSINQIRMPFELSYSALDVIQEFPVLLSELFPAKAAWFHRIDMRVLELAINERIPFGPSSGVLLSSLFSDFHAAVYRVLESGFFKKIIINGLDRRLHWHEDNVEFRKKSKGKARGVELSLAEFRTVHDAIVEKKRNRNRLLSLFINFENTFCFYLPQSIPLNKLTDVEPAIADFLENNPSAKPYSPLCHIHHTLNGSLPDEAHTQVLFSDTGYYCAPRHSHIHAFPYNNCRIGVVYDSSPVKEDEVPCNNCLRCFEVCPSSVYPNILFHMIRNEKPDDAEKCGVTLCTGCGLCSCVCPAGLPLASEIRSYLSKHCNGACHNDT